MGTTCGSVEARFGNKFEYVRTVGMEWELNC